MIAVSIMGVISLVCARMKKITDCLSGAYFVARQILLLLSFWKVFAVGDRITYLKFMVSNLKNLIRIYT